jgi:hypothetical protein
MCQFTATTTEKQKNVTILNKIHTNNSNIRHCLCGLVVRIPGYKSRGPRLDFRRYQIFCEVVGLDRGSLSLVRIIEELLQRTVAAPVYKTEINGRGKPLR